MKKFLAIYIGTASALEKSGWSKMDDEQRREREAAGIQAWMEWGTAHAEAIASHLASSRYPRHTYFIVLSRSSPQQA